MREFEKIKTAIIRGGTSKGVFILESELPTDPFTRDQVILSIYGGHDERQIDGLGGADSLTSKLAVVRASARPDADIDFTFGQVGIGSGKIDYNSNCGNILSGVGPFAIDEGLVPAKEPFTKVRIYNTNTKALIEATVPVQYGKAAANGDYQIDGVPGTGSKIELNFLNPAGSKTGKLFPTGKRKEILQCNGKEIEVSIVDITAPVVFVQPKDLGLTGREMPHDLTTENLWELENIRSKAAELIGLVDDANEATKKTPSSPKVIMVSDASSFDKIGSLDESNINLNVRALSMQKMHKAIPVTGGLCTATAAKIKGTVVHECSKPTTSDNMVLGHPSGKTEFLIDLVEQNGDVILKKVCATRTARRIMEGYAFVPHHVYWPQKENVHSFDLYVK